MMDIQSALHIEYIGIRVFSYASHGGFFHVRVLIEKIDKLLKLGITVLESEHLYGFTWGMK